MLSVTHPAEVAVYARFALRPVRGQGCFLWDAKGRRYLDMYGGHARVAVAGKRHRVAAVHVKVAPTLAVPEKAAPATHRAQREARIDRDLDRVRDAQHG